MLKLIEQSRNAALRERMNEAGCVFQFVLLQADADDVANEALHRQALQGLHDQVMKEALEWHHALLKNPHYANREAPQLDWASERAVAHRVPTSELEALVKSLYGAFRQPPYGTQFEGGEAEAHALFREWVERLGLVENEQPEVIDWVADLDPDVDGAPSPWSSYFDDGLQWWGVWCLTIWNPRHRTMGALIASSTD